MSASGTSAAPGGAVDLPVIVLQKADVDGDGGRAWAEALPSVLRDLAHRWSLDLGEAYGGASESYVARARTADGRDVVLKVCVPSDDFTARADVLRVADGDGVVQLLDADDEHHAVLLEALGPDLASSALEPEQWLPVTARLLPRLWRRPPPPSLGPAVDKAAGLAALVTALAESLPDAATTGVVAAALDCAARRSSAFDPATSRLLHGDAAAANLLRVPAPRPGAPDGYVLSDPQPFVGDPAYDVGVALRDWVGPLQRASDPVAALRGWCRSLADATGCDPAAVWDWALLERVSTGLYATSLGAPEAGLPLLASTERLLGG